MGIELKTHKLLWAASGSLCAKCKRQVVEDPTETDDESLVGDEAHIVSKKKKGPRFDDPLPMEKRDLVGNLVVLCKTCHKTVDDQENTFSVATLRKMKADHEQWVKATLGHNDIESKRTDLVYASYIDEWSKQAKVDKWHDWSYSMLTNGKPRMTVEQFEQLSELIPWMLGRVWPGRYPRLEAAFQNFRIVSNDLLNSFRVHAEEVGNGSLLSTVGYNPTKWLKQDEFDKGLDAHEYQVYLVMDLMLELTRAANYLCDMARQFISPSYRIEEGAILAIGGPFEDGTEKTWNLNYVGEERTEMPYPGLEKFRKVRLTRKTFVFGVGEDKR